MFGTILVCTDFSDHAAAALRCARQFPGIRSLIVLHVVDATHVGKRGWTYNPEIENSRLVLDELAARLRSAGVPAQARTEVATDTTVPGTILEVAGEEDADLIVTGARGRGAVGGLLLGSTSRSIVTHATRDVLVYRGTGERSCSSLFSRVLFPTDFSPPSETAFRKLKGLGDITGIMLLHVVTRGESRKEIQAFAGEAKEKLEMLARDLGSGMVSTSVHVRVGDPAGEILRFAHDEEAGLIFMSAHGEGILREILQGSTSREVTRRAGCPVLIARESPGNAVRE